MKWFQRWQFARKFADKIAKVDAVLLQPNQFLVFYTRGIHSHEQMLLIKERLGICLEGLNIEFLVLPFETIEKIDVINKESEKKDE